MPDTARDKRKHDFFITYNIIIDKYLPLIGHPAFVVYSVLVRMADGDGHSFPGLKYLETKSKYSRNTVLTAIEILETHRLIHVVRHKEPGQRESNEYWITDVSKSDNANETGSSTAPVDTKPVESMTPTSSIPDTRPVESLHSNKTESKQDTWNKTTIPEGRLNTNDSLLLPLSATPVSNAPPVETVSDTIAQMQAVGVTVTVAKNLVLIYGGVACLKQLRWLDARKAKDRAAVLVQSIKEDWAEPASAQPARTRSLAQTARKTPQDAPTEEQRAAAKQALTEARKKTRVA